MKQKLQEMKNYRIGHSNVLESSVVYKFITQCVNLYEYLIDEVNHFMLWAKWLSTVLSVG